MLKKRDISFRHFREYSKFERIFISHYTFESWVENSWKSWDAYQKKSEIKYWRRILNRSSFLYPTTSNEWFRICKFLSGWNQVEKIYRPCRASGNCPILDLPPEVVLRFGAANRKWYKSRKEKYNSSIYKDPDSLKLLKMIKKWNWIRNIPTSSNDLDLKTNFETRIERILSD